MFTDHVRLNKFLVLFPGKLKPAIHEGIFSLWKKKALMHHFKETVPLAEYGAFHDSDRLRLAQVSCHLQPSKSLKYSSIVSKYSTLVSLISKGSGINIGNNSCVHLKKSTKKSRFFHVVKMEKNSKKIQNFFFLKIQIFFGFF